ncbi:MAG: TetR/AcrR family transcriptional regulator [Corynebacterium sp.]|nr:TetR/AcrR family transcriptional regulator [Corynebacterium sp.]
MTPTNPNRRAEIIDAAERRFIAQGYLRTSVAEIISDAGIAKGTFYHYFPSKESLMLAIIDKNVNYITTSVEEVVSDSTIPPMDKFFLLFSGDFTFSPEAEAISVELTQGGNELMHMWAIDATVKALIPPITRLFEELADTGHIDCPNPESAASALLIIAQTFDRDLLGWFTNRNINALHGIIDIWERIIGAPTGTLKPIADKITSTQS